MYWNSFYFIVDDFLFKYYRALTCLKLWKVGHTMFGFSIQNVCYKNGTHGTDRIKNDRFG